MKRYLFFCLAIFMLAGCSNTTSKSDFSKDFTGFRDIKWGTSLETVKNELVLQNSDEKRNVEWFTKKNDKMKIGKADLESIGYVFQDGKFVAVSIVSKGRLNYEALRKELEKRLGKIEPVKSDAFSYDLGHATLLLNFSPPAEITMLMMRAKGN